MSENGTLRVEVTIKDSPPSAVVWLPQTAAVAVSAIPLPVYQVCPVYSCHACDVSNKIHIHIVKYLMVKEHCIYKQSDRI